MCIEEKVEIIEADDRFLFRCSRGVGFSSVIAKTVEQEEAGGSKGRAQKGKRRG